MDTLARSTVIFFFGGRVMVCLIRVFSRHLGFTKNVESWDKRKSVGAGKGGEKTSPSPLTHLSARHPLPCPLIWTRSQRTHTQITPALQAGMDT